MYVGLNGLSNEDFLQLTGEFPRARVPCIAGSEFSYATVVRGDAKTKYLKRCRAAYGVENGEPSYRCDCMARLGDLFTNSAITGGIERG